MSGLFLVDGSLGFNDLANFEIGDAFYEQDFGIIGKSVVISKPVVSMNDDMKQVRFSAKVNDFDKTSETWGEERVVEYLATDGYMHYGGKFYKSFAKWNYETQTATDL